MQYFCVSNISYSLNILRTETTAAQNEVVLSLWGAYILYILSDILSSHELCEKSHVSD